MRGPKPSDPRTLTDAEAKRLEHLIRAHTTPQALALRARIMLQAQTHPEQRTQQRARALGTTDRTVRKWRGRWVKTHQLADAPRSGAPRRVSPSGTRARHGHRLSLAQTGRGATLALESDRSGSACRPEPCASSPLSQYRGSLAPSRTASSLAFSCLAAHP
jgi:hypothetical protein